MFNPLKFFSRGVALAGFVYFATSSFPVNASTSIESLWSQSLEDYKKGDLAGACTKLEDWVKIQKENRVESPEAYFNLALCSWKLKQPAQSTTYLFQSFILRNSIFKRFSDLKLLQTLQREIGIRDNLPGRYSFILPTVIPPWIFLLLGLVGFWILILYLLFFRTRPHLRWLFLSSLAVTWTLALGLGLLPYTLGTLAVISSTEPTALISWDKLGKPQELATLPAGTLVELGKQPKNSFIQILKPVGGWVHESSVTRLPQQEIKD
ncbi:MAG: hypothetical protein ACKOA8_12000 [Deltaproteobacteria bacterium]